MDPSEAPQPILPQVVAQEAQRRGVYVLTPDVKYFNPTPGCRGCDSVVQHGKVLPGLSHTQTCRERFERLLEGDEAGRRRLERIRRGKRGAQANVDPGADGQEVTAGEAAGEPRRKRKAVAPAEDPRTAGTDDAEIVGVSEPRAAATTAPENAASSSSSSTAVIGGVPSGPPGASGAIPAAPTAEDQMDVEDLADTPMGNEPAAMQGHLSATDLQSLEVVDRQILTGLKAELYGLVQHQLKEQYRLQEVDITSHQLDQIATMALELGAVDVAEVYSPGRFTERCKEFQLRPGFAADLMELKENGATWDLEKPSDVQELEAEQFAQDPYLLTGSPPCEAFSPLLNISKAKRDPAKIASDLDRGKHHLKVACDCYERQMSRGRYFLHEHPARAASWQEDCITEMQKRDGVYTVQGPMCNWGMTATDKREEVPFTGYVRKETKWMTNCKPLADLLEGVCSNVDESAPWHRHVHLINGLAAQAAVYPPALVEAVLRALRQQMLEDGQISELQAAESGPVCEEPFVPPGEWYEYWDDVHGVQLDKKLVEEARQVERDWVKKQGVY